MNAKLSTLTFPVAVEDAALALGLSRKYTRTLLVKAVRAGELLHNADGTFALPVAAKKAKVAVVVLDEVGETIKGLTTVALNRVCKNGADHEHRVTQSGTYCYTCDRIAAEAQKAARAAAKATVAAAEAHANGIAV